VDFSTFYLLKKSLSSVHVISETLRKMSIPVLFEIYKYRMRTNILHIIAALLVVLVLLCMTRSEGFVSSSLTRSDDARAAEIAAQLSKSDYDGRRDKRK
jgi:hypothetical protein